MMIQHLTWRHFWFCLGRACFFEILELYPSHLFCLDLLSFGLFLLWWFWLLWSRSEIMLVFRCWHQFLWLWTFKIGWLPLSWPFLGCLVLILRLVLLQSLAFDLFAQSKCLPVVIHAEELVIQFGLQLLLLLLGHVEFQIEVIVNDVPVRVRLYCGTHVDFLLEIDIRLVCNIVYFEEAAEEVVQGWYLHLGVVDIGR